MRVAETQERRRITDTRRDLLGGQQRAEHRGQRCFPHLGWDFERLVENAQGEVVGDDVGEGRTDELDLHGVTREAAEGQSGWSSAERASDPAPPGARTYLRNPGVTRQAALPRGGCRLQSATDHLWLSGLGQPFHLGPSSLVRLFRTAVASHGWPGSTGLTVRQEGDTGDPKDGQAT